MVMQSMWLSSKQADHVIQIDIDTNIFRTESNYSLKN